MPRPKQYEILNNSKNRVLEVDVDGHRVEIKRKGGGLTVDSGLAKEIDARYGMKAKTETAGKIMVIEVDDRDPKREQGHQYSFSMPDLSRFKGWGK